LSVDVGDELARARDAVRTRFDEEKRVLSYREYLELVAAHPWRHTRDAARYLRDCIQHFGEYEVERPWGKVRRWRVFDRPFDEDQGRRRSDRLVGHEALQRGVVRAINAFQREGRANRLLLLHGPNGSAKSTFVACLMAGLEAYSQEPEGAAYRFSWVFPRGSKSGGIGFTTDKDNPPPGGTYAHLPEERIDAKLPSELREHPLLLLPVPQRRQLMARLYEENGIEESPPDLLFAGELGHRNRQVFEALLTAYRGDLESVLAHVQVERFAISRRFRQGAVTIGPEMAVDARERQLTVDRSFGSLPASLSALSLFETQGELVDGSGGLIEYSDLLKRPLDAWKYLLLAIESGEVALQMSNMPINAVMVASSNELHLGAFQQHPEYHSFRGRLVLQRVPYLRDYLQEQGIYDAQIVPQVRKHVAPHTTYVAALWAVLTRLRRAQPKRYEQSVLGRIASDLSPLEKAELYATGEIPRRLDRDESKLLAQGIGEIYEERAGTSDYEGLAGASPREMRMLLLDAATDPDEPCLSPEGLLDRLAAFCERDDYEFLRIDTDRGYHDSKAFVDQVRERWLDLVDDELRTCSGLVDESQYRELFDKYVSHVSHAIKKERVYNEHTGEYEEPDVELMNRVERTLAHTDLEVADAQAFRDELMSTVAAWAIDHPDEQVDYVSLFPRYIEALEEAYYEERRKQIGDMGRAILATTGYEPPPSVKKQMDEGDLKSQAESARTLLEERHGYAEPSLKVALGALLRARYDE